MMTKAAKVMAALGAAIGLHVGAQAHGNKPIEQDTCAHQISGNWLHYSAYQPKLDPKAEYCDDIPQVGDTVLVIDIVDKRLREQELGVKVSGPDDSGETKTMMDLPAKRHTTGVVDTTVNFKSPGRYVVSIISQSTSQEVDRMEFTVAQINWPKQVRQWVIPVLLSTLIVWLGLRAKRWLSSRSARRQRR
jgi:hypothetical protein